MNDEDLTLDKVIESMKDEYVRCRDFLHSWRPFHLREFEHGYDQQIRCTRCYTIKHRALSFSGQVLSVHYEYPDGYVVKGLGRLTGEDRDQLRLASVLRTLHPVKAVTKTSKSGRKTDEDKSNNQVKKAG